ncbi:MAG TPA: hypothetical protein VFM17_01585, partial [Candidatus Eisenbacteria bacterium]|nr:hypothetical protein [Candidatus Eisenbacteria bacterium]
EALLMRTDEDEVEYAALALLTLAAFDDCVSWKTCDFGVTEALLERGRVGDPRSGNKSRRLPAPSERGSVL